MTFESTLAEVLTICIFGTIIFTLPRPLFYLFEKIEKWKDKRLAERQNEDN